MWGGATAGGPAPVSGPRGPCSRVMVEDRPMTSPSYSPAEKSLSLLAGVTEDDVAGVYRRSIALW